MPAQNIFIAHPKNVDQVDALKAIMKAMKIKFEIASGEKPYDPDFVDMVIRAKEEIKDGKGLKVTSEQFDDLWK